MPLDPSHLDSDVVDSLSQGVLVCDAEGVVLRVNACLARLTGYLADELTGLHASLLFDPAELSRRIAELPFLAMHEPGRWTDGVLLPPAQGRIWHPRWRRV
ncbi:MAG: hypothetical protein GAK30_01863 [Paracidovorax wautersii]|uniref:PAS domain-containing protein n=1 Tax=Paracidovorax wautersii TaxID=1177982 RepID=A0A7V8FP34_9BURK|nr:MAG: hypothetical protein GAK30_01863 [Paracidovorax wautersii]